jgi:hypothetical protein
MEFCNNLRNFQFHPVPCSTLILLAQWDEKRLNAIARKRVSMILSSLRNTVDGHFSPRMEGARPIGTKLIAIGN